MYRENIKYTLHSNCQVPQFRCQYCVSSAFLSLLVKCKSSLCPVGSVLRNRGDRLQSAVRVLMYGTQNWHFIFQFRWHSTLSWTSKWHLWLQFVWEEATRTQQFMFCVQDEAARTHQFMFCEQEEAARTQQFMFCVQDEMLILKWNWVMSSHCGPAVFVGCMLMAHLQGDTCAVPAYTSMLVYWLLLRHLGLGRGRSIITQLLRNYKTHFMLIEQYK